MQIGLSYQHEMSKGVTMTVSTLIEGNSFNAGGHKMGFGLELDLWEFRIEYSLSL